MNNMRVNGKLYDWGDVDFKVPGLSGLRIQSISYDDELEKELIYSKGRKPRGFGMGNYKAEGKVTLLREDYDTLTDYCKSINTPLFQLVIPKIVVSYANAGERTRSDTLNMLTITKRSSKGSQGDKSLTVDLDFLLAGTIEADGLAAL